MKGLMPGIELMKQEERRLLRLALYRLATIIVWGAVVAMLVVRICTR